MTDMDQLLRQMMERHVERAVLIGGQPARLAGAGRVAAGPVVPDGWLRHAVEQITPIDMRGHLVTDANLHFVHHSDYGSFNVAILHPAGAFEVIIGPVPNVDTHGHPTSPFVHPAAPPAAAHPTAAAPAAPSYASVAPPPQQPPAEAWSDAHVPVADTLEQFVGAAAEHQPIAFRIGARDHHKTIANWADLHGLHYHKGLETTSLQRLHLTCLGCHHVYPPSHLEMLKKLEAGPLKLSKKELKNPDTQRAKLFAESGQCPTCGSPDALFVYPGAA